MVFRVEFESGLVEWATAKSVADLFISYELETTMDIQDIVDVEELSDNEIKATYVRNSDYVEGGDEPKYIPLSDLVTSDDFKIIASTEY